MGSDAIYRFEHAKSARAGCTNSACKSQQIKIQKGERRMGVLYTLPDGHQGWSWKHWGCVTPLQIKNIQDNVDGLDLDKDLDILDGWEELDEEFQEKIKQAIRDGHVADEDWRGDPELNRPGKKGINKTRTPKKAAEPVDDDGSDKSPSKPAPKKKAATKKRKADAEDAHEAEEELAPKARKKASNEKTKVESDLSDEAEDEPAPQKKSKARAKTAKAIKAEEDLEDEIVEPVVKRAKPKAKAAKAVKKEEDTDDEVLAPSARPKRASRSKKQSETGPGEDGDQDDVEEEAKEKPKRSRAKKVKEESDDAVESAPRSRKKSIKQGAADTGAEVPQPAPAKAKKGRKVKKEPSPDSEPEPTANGEAAAEEEAVAEPIYPVIPAVDGPAEDEVKPKKGGKKIKKEEVVESIEMPYAPPKPARGKKTLPKDTPMTAPSTGGNRRNSRR